MKRYGITIISLLCFLIIWFVISTNVNNLFVPTPISVLNGFASLNDTGQLWNGILYSFYRVTLASVLSGIVSVFLGLLIYSNRYIRDVLLPIVKMLRYIPVTAFYPLLIMWCGIGEEMKVSFLFIVTFVSMLPSMVIIFMDISDDLIDTGLTIGMNRFQVIRMIVFPATLPSIYETFLLQISIGWTYIPIVETINARYGLGYIIQQSSDRGRTDLVFAAIITIIVISLIFDKGGMLLHRLIFKWKYLNSSED